MALLTPIRRSRGSSRYLRGLLQLQLQVGQLQDLLVELQRGDKSAVRGGNNYLWLSLDATLLRVGQLVGVIFVTLDGGR
ncbi:hypothetical protein EYF80_033554 [Liparis tanakae]|uniref:Uncharacterized protein n=1 Tax=Liparis tanakae TaxID=230148 RepID=A0A4Z2GSH5_9TELE|nr:hypothetical protein EYF80_033554 [Liparis tanakae]